MPRNGQVVLVLSSPKDVIFPDSVCYSRHVKKPNARPKLQDIVTSKPKLLKEGQDLTLKAAATMAAALVAASVAAPGPAQAHQKQKSN